MPTATPAVGQQTPTSQHNLPPFTLASAFTSRQAFTVSNVLLTTATQQPVGFPLNIRTFGWVSNIVLEFTLPGTTGGVLGPAGAAGIIDRIGVRTSAGQPLIAPITGYNLYLDNKYGGKTFGPSTPYGVNADPYTQYGVNTNPANNAGTLHFFLALQFEVDHSSGLGCIPSTASDREFTIDLTLASISEAFTTQPTTPADLLLSVNATAWYWDLPAAGQVPFGVSSTSQTYRLLQIERGPINEGLNTYQSSNKGNVIMNSIIKVLNSSGVPTEAAMSDPYEIDLDNNPRLWFTQAQWRAAMTQWYGYGENGQALGAAGGQDAGVFVVPWRLFAGGQGADPNGSHAQYFTTLNTSQIDFKGYNYGATAASLEILTDSITTPDPRYIFSK